MESISSEDLPVSSSHSMPSPTLYPKPTNRNEACPPPPPYRHSRLTPPSSSSVMSQSQQHPQQLGKSGNQNSPAGTLTPTSPEWQDWQRDRWHIWQLLSSDNADTLPETLVWCQIKQFSVFIYRRYCLVCVMYRLVMRLSSSLCSIGSCGSKVEPSCTVETKRGARKIPGSKPTDHTIGVGSVQSPRPNKWSLPSHLLARSTCKPTCHSGSEAFSHFLFLPPIGKPALQAVNQVP